MSSNHFFIQTRKSNVVLCLPACTFPDYKARRFLSHFQNMALFSTSYKLFQGTHLISNCTLDQRRFLWLTKWKILLAKFKRSFVGVCGTVKDTDVSVVLLSWMSYTSPIFGQSNSMWLHISGTDWFFWQSIKICEMALCAFQKLLQGIVCFTYWYLQKITQKRFPDICNITIKVVKVH